jgi:MipA family protein
MQMDSSPRSRLLGVVAVLAAGLAAGARGAEAPSGAPAATIEVADSSASPWRLGVAVGYGLRTNPVLQSEDIPVLVDLDVAWFGDRFFFDNGDAGFTLADNSALTVSLVGRVNSDRVFFGKTDTRFVQVTAAGQALQTPTLVEVPDRDYAVELGVEILADGRWGLLQLAAHRDVDGTHGGYEIFADYGFAWRRQRWLVQPSVGFAYKSSNLNDYYWGVRPEEANAALPAYRAGSGTNLHAKVSVSYQINRQWAAAGAAEYEGLNAAASASPIANEDGVVGYFVGMSYRF